MEREGRVDQAGAHPQVTRAARLLAVACAVVLACILALVGRDALLQVGGLVLAVAVARVLGRESREFQRRRYRD